MKALDIVNSVFSHRFQTDPKGPTMVLGNVNTNEVRKCVNELACSVDNPEILKTFKRLVGLGDANAGEIVDFLKPRFVSHEPFYKNFSTFNQE